MTFLNGSDIIHSSSVTLHVCLYMRDLARVDGSSWNPLICDHKSKSVQCHNRALPYAILFMLLSFI